MPPAPEPHSNPAVRPSTWAGSDGLVLGPDGLPARKVKAHNAHKAHYIEQYAQIVARSMKNKWPYRCYIDLYAGPGLCWVEDSCEFVTGSPLIALGTAPAYTHHVFVDKDSDCTDALAERTQGSGALIRCADSNAPETIEWVRRSIPRRGALSLALLDPQGCTLGIETIRQLTHDRPMDLLINLPIHNLYRCLGARYWHVLDHVLGPDWPKNPPGGVPGWRYAIREHYKAKLAELGYRYSSSKEVRGEKRNGRLYDFILASRHPLAQKLFESVTKETAHGQIAML